jgi:hypothetical protein
MSFSEAKEEDVGEGGPIAFWMTVTVRWEIPNRVIKLLERGKTGLGGGRKPCPAQARCSKSLILPILSSSPNPLTGHLRIGLLFDLNTPLRPPKPLGSRFLGHSGAREPHWIQCRPCSLSTPRYTRFALGRSKTPQMRSLQRKNSKRSRRTLSNFAGIPWNVPRRPMTIYGLSRSL